MKFFNCLLILCLPAAIPVWCADVSGNVELYTKKITGSVKTEKVEGVIVYLLPKDETARKKLMGIPVVTQWLNQKNKSFLPHTVAVQKGGKLRFGNEDIWFHNVYSNTPKFDLGRYSKGYWKEQLYEKTGVFHVFCDIHPNMHATVFVIDTPYFNSAKSDGTFRIQNVMPGKYQVFAWQIRSKLQSQYITVANENFQDMKFVLQETRIKREEKEKTNRIHDPCYVN